MNAPVGDWPRANQRYLSAALAVLRQRLQQASQPNGQTPDEAERRQAENELRAATAGLPSPAALERLAALFNLTEFERNLLLLCAGAELDTRFPVLCGAVQDDPNRAYPTFALALAVLPEAHWDALLPDAPLRYWHLLDVATGVSNPLVAAPLRIDEKILHYLRGAQCLDERLLSLVSPARCSIELTLSQIDFINRLVSLWSQSDRQPPAVQLCGADASTRKAIALAACNRLSQTLEVLPAWRLPTNPGELEALARLWQRESMLGHRVLMLDFDSTTSLETSRLQAAADMIEQANFPLIVASAERQRSRRSLVTLDIPHPAVSEQRALWQREIDVKKLNGQLDRILGQFNLGPTQIASVAASLSHTREGEVVSPDAEFVALWDACRAEARPRLNDLAQRIDSPTGWQDLVLPDQQTETLRSIEAQVRQRFKVYECWGFAAKDRRGLGISALFAGPSGTGKTLAAEVLANELRLDLYRIDLSQVVSKYIGETEKNLRQVFDAAEIGGAVLLFDEADALFGKRSEVKDGHDRYANIEVSYLLQRMEAYRGLAILTTNMKQALDQAFLRRIRFVVQFPFPDLDQRTEIWRRVFPADVPQENLTPELLARLNVTGGNIRNIALGAAFLAADKDTPVKMEHLLRAAKIECSKLKSR